MKLTIGMATHNDFDGAYFTVNALRLYHADVMPQCEIIIVDNDPDGPAANRLMGLCANVTAGATKECLIGGSAGHPVECRYVPFGGAIGTAPPRQAVFDAAKGDAVLVMDSHVMIQPGGLRALLAHFDSGECGDDLISGPLLYDSLSGMATHFADNWNNGMWGTWAFDNRFESGHPFEIPAMGLGLFACRRSAWPGFNPHFREFGGEEFYIHEKFRLHGNHCLCLPRLGWMHRFGNPAPGRTSPLTLEGKVRNYVLGHLELGIDPGRMIRHFVIGENTNGTKSGDYSTISKSKMAALLNNPEAYPPASLSVA